MFDQRSRATTKRRGNNIRPSPESNPRDELRKWIGAHFGDPSIDEIERFDLKAFMRDTARFELTPNRAVKKTWVKT